MIYDFVVVGAGIAGCSVAHFLKKEGHSVAVLDNDKVCNGASGAAGAFLSPMMGKGGHVKDLTNEAFKFSLDYYKSNFPDLLVQNGLLRLEKKVDKDFENLDEYIDLEFEKRENGYFFPDGAMIDPKELCNALIDGCDLYKETVKDLKMKNNLYSFSTCKGKTVILAIGGYESFLEEPYLDIRSIWGERLEIDAPVTIPYNIAKNVGISTTLKNGKIAIGSTHIQNQKTWICDEARAATLLDEAITIVPELQGSKIDNIHSGMRPGSIDYAPIVGKIYDTRRVLKEHPSLRNGTKIPSKLLPIYKDLYIHTAHGGRGFVTALYTANELTKSIINNKILDPKFSTDRLLYRWVRKTRDIEQYL